MSMYKSLNPSRREIRLVRFVPDALPVNGPGDPREIISLEVQHVSLNDDITYAALSYVWGDASIVEEINVGGARFWVTENLYAALKQFRDDRLDSWMWIDAICIDQSNQDRKSVV